MSCSYPAPGLNARDYFRSKIANTDPLTHDTRNDSACRSAEFVGIKNKYCTKCNLFLAQGIHIMHTSAPYISTGCGSLDLTVVTCGDGTPVKYFGMYNCYDLPFECTKTDLSTTQFWFALET